MANRYLIFPEHDLVYLEYSGFVSRTDQAELITAVTSDPLFDRDMPRLSYCRNVTDTEFGFNNLMYLRDLFSDAYTNVEKPLKWAQLAPDDLAFGLARMLQALLSEIEGIEMEVFRDTEEALGFLGLDGTDLATRLDI